MLQLDAAKEKGKDAINELTSGIDALNNTTKIADASIIKLGLNMGRLIIPTQVLKDTEALRELSYNLTAESMGQTKVIGDAVAHTMALATFETLQFGVGLDENLNLMKQMNDVMQVNTLLTDEQAVNMQVVAKTAGISATELAPLVRGFRDLGVGTNQAIENISDMAREARDYGLNVGQFMSSISSNVSKLSSYGFKDGVKGLSSMVSKAQALRIDIGTTFKLAEKLMDPEQAIKTAAAFQMMGGEVGALGDGFQLLHMAQTDAEGLQDAMVNMASSAADYNEETGKFEYSVAQKYRLRDAAEALGMSYEDLASTGIKAAEQSQKLDMLSSVRDLSEEDRTLLSNMGEIEGGEFKVKLAVKDEKGNTKTKELSVAELTSDNLKLLRDQQETNSKSDREIAMEQLTALQIMAGAVDSAESATMIAGVQTKGVTDALDAGRDAGKAILNGLNESLNEEEIADYGEALTKHIATGFQNADFAEHFQSTATRMADVMVGELRAVPEMIQKSLDDDNIIKGMDLEAMAALNIQSLGTKIDDMKNLLKDSFTPEQNLIIAKAKDELEGFNGVIETIMNTMAGYAGDTMDNIRTTRQSSGQDMGTADDFISRPNMPLQKFNENDIVIAGTNLIGDIMGGGSPSPMSGDINLNVGGKIDLSVDGRNLPQNITSEQLANEIVNNPEFTSKLMNIFTDANNTYRS